MNGLTLNNFLALIIEFSFSILFMIVFASIHFTLINKTKLNSKLESSKVFSFWYFFIFGLVLALVTFIVSQATALSINTFIGLPVTILGLIFALTIFYNRSVQVGAFIPTIIWVLYYYLWTTDSPGWDCWGRLIIIGAIAIIAICTTFFKTKKWPTYLISLLISCISMLILVLVFWDDNSAFYLVELGLSAVSSIIFYAIISWLNNMFNTMNYMAKTNLYTDDYYIIPSALNDQFRQFIKTNNISQALVVTFDIKNNKDKNLKFLAGKFNNKESLLFKTQYDTYGVILCNNEYFITDLNASYLANNVPKRMVPDPLAWLEKEIEGLEIIAFVSVYGIHSNDLDELLMFNQYAIKQFDESDTTNRVQLFNSNMLNNQIQDEISYVQLTQKVDLSEFDIKLEIIRLKNNKKYVCPRYYWTKNFTCDLNYIIKQFDSNTSNALLRSLAIKSIESYCLSDYKGNIPLLIFYPITELNNPFFATNQFIKKIHLYGLHRKDIVLSFDCKPIRLWPRTILNNLKELQDNNVKFMFVDLINTYALTLLKPDCVILDKTIENNQSKYVKALEVAKKYNQVILLTK